mmetsp:Transcript_13721/g.20718  ORF Transcript_13721/g.20718 Transcript_13721/m.20718 type:complete len:1029 (+) Transcript_13721:163-3249(+)
MDVDADETLNTTTGEFETPIGNENWKPIVHLQDDVSLQDFLVNSPLGSQRKLPRAHSSEMSPQEKKREGWRVSSGEIRKLDNDTFHDFTNVIFDPEAKEASCWPYAEYNIGINNEETSDSLFKVPGAGTRVKKHEEVKRGGVKYENMTVGSPSIGYLQSNKFQQKLSEKSSSNDERKMKYFDDKTVKAEMDVIDVTSSFLKEDTATEKKIEKKSCKFENKLPEPKTVAPSTQPVRRRRNSLSSQDSDNKSHASRTSRSSKSSAGTSRASAGTSNSDASKALSTVALRAEARAWVEQNVRKFRTGKIHVIREENVRWHRECRRILVRCKYCTKFVQVFRPKNRLTPQLDTSSLMRHWRNTCKLRPRNQESQTQQGGRYPVTTGPQNHRAARRDSKYQPPPQTNLHPQTNRNIQMNGHPLANRHPMNGYPSVNTGIAAHAAYVQQVTNAYNNSNMIPNPNAIPQASVVAQGNMMPPPRQNKTFVPNLRRGMTLPTYEEQQRILSKPVATMQVIHPPTYQTVNAALASQNTIGSSTSYSNAITQHQSTFPTFNRVKSSPTIPPPQLESRNTNGGVIRAAAGTSQVPSKNLYCYGDGTVHLSLDFDVDSIPVFNTQEQLLDYLNMRRKQLYTGICHRIFGDTKDRVQISFPRRIEEDYKVWMDMARNRGKVRTIWNLQFKFQDEKFLKEDGSQDLKRCEELKTVCGSLLTELKVGFIKLEAGSGCIFIKAPMEKAKDISTILDARTDIQDFFEHVKTEFRLKSSPQISIMQERSNHCRARLSIRISSTRDVMLTAIEHLAWKEFSWSFEDHAIVSAYHVCPNFYQLPNKSLCTKAMEVLSKKLPPFASLNKLFSDVFGSLAPQLMTNVLGYWAFHTGPRSVTVQKVPKALPRLHMRRRSREFLRRWKTNAKSPKGHLLHGIYKIQWALHDEHRDDGYEAEDVVSHIDDVKKCGGNVIQAFRDEQHGNYHRHSTRTSRQSRSHRYNLKHIAYAYFEKEIPETRKTHTRKAMERDIPNLFMLQDSIFCAITGHR